MRFPLFPGYLFCRFDGSSLIPILSAAGVIQILSRNGVPEPVRKTEIASINTLLSQGHLLLPWPTFEAGETVRLISGPLAGIEGIVVRDDRVTKLVVSVSLLKRSLVTEIDRSWVEATPKRLMRAYHVEANEEVA